MPRSSWKITDAISFRWNDRDRGVCIFETTRDASLVIGIYEEDGIKMLASGSVEVSRGQTETVVDIEAASMPQYFYIRGFLVETDTLRPVCTPMNPPCIRRNAGLFV